MNLSEKFIIWLVKHRTKVMYRSWFIVGVITGWAILSLNVIKPYLDFIIYRLSIALLILGLVVTGGLYVFLDRNESTAITHETRPQEEEP